MISRERVNFEFKKRDQLIWESLDDLIVVVEINNNNNVEYINEEVYKSILGYTRKDLIGKSFKKIIHSSDLNKFQDFIDNLGTNYQQNELRIKKSNDSNVWVEIKAKHFRDNDNQQKIFIKLKDISKFKNLEIELEDSNKKIAKIADLVPEIRFWDLFTPKRYDEALHNSYTMIENITENIPQYICWKDKNLTYVRCNNKYAKFIGRSSPANITGKTDYELIKNNNIKNFNEKELEVMNSNNAEYHVIESWTYKDGNKIWLDVNRIPLQDPKGKVLGILITYEDITERKITDQKIKESEVKYRDIAELLPDVIFETDLNLNLTYVNSIAFKKFGYSKEDLRSGLSVTQIIHPKSMQRASINIKLILEGKETLPEEYLLLKKDRSSFYALVHSRPIIKNEKIVGLRGTITDINNLILAKQDLKESEDKFRTITEQSFMGIIILQDGIFKYFNEQARRLNGYSVEEIKSWKPYEFLKVIHPEDKDFVTEQAKKKENGNDDDVVRHYKYRLIPKKGKIHWIENYSKTIIYKGRIADLIMSVDISDKIYADQKLLESEKRYRNLFNSSLYFVGLLDTSGILIDCNDTANQFFSKHTKEDLIGKTIGEIFSIQERNKPLIPLLEQEFKEIINGESPKSFDFKFNRTIGDYLWIHLEASLIEIENNELIQVILQNITEKKEAEQKLKESEKKFRSLFENSPIALMDQDFSDMKRYVDHLKASGINDFKKYFDNNPDELLKIMLKPKIIDVNRKTLEVYKAKSKEDFMLRINQLCEDLDSRLTEEVFLDNKMEILSLINGETMYESEIVSKTFTGDTIYLYSKTSIVPGFESTWSKIIVSIVNITDRKLTEQKLKESEKKYRSLFENMNAGFAYHKVIVDDQNKPIDYEYIEVNPAFEKLTGLKKEDLVGKRVTEAIPGTENDPADWIGKFGNIGLTGIPLTVEDYSKVIDKWYKVSGYSPKKGYFAVTFSDITDQKKMEENLKESEEKFRELLTNSAIGILEIDALKNKVSYTNPKLLEILGYSQTELFNEEIQFKVIHPDDFNKIMGISEGEELEFRIFDKYGKLKWLSGSRKDIYSKKNELTSITLWLEDITERKMYEELIYELNINFLNFTADIRYNIDLLLNMCHKLLGGDIVLYINRSVIDEKESYQIITNDKKELIFNSNQFVDDLFSSALFYEEHDFPQTFFDIHKMDNAKTDPFILENDLKGCFGKLIKSQNDFNSAVCVFYKTNPTISNQDKLVLFLICDAIEIEQRRWQVQRDLEKQNITLDKINKLKTDLFSRTSHELKTPLISIKGFTELLLTVHKAKLDNDVISILEEIRDGSKRLENIIKLLLEGTKLEAGQYELNLSEEDLTFLIKFCVNELRGLVRLRSQTITLELHDELKTKFDKERIYDVISNLLVNAIKYTPLEGNIIIQSEVKDDFFIISVKDNGIGFTEEEKSQVFKQFGKIERYGQGWDVDIEGTGLGLYITKKIIEIHGGHIWLESEGRNKGSTFFFSIPIL